MFLGKVKLHNHAMGQLCPIGGCAPGGLPGLTFGGGATAGSQWECSPGEVLVNGVCQQEEAPPPSTPAPAPTQAPVSTQPPSSGIPVVNTSSTQMPSQEFPQETFQDPTAASTPTQEAQKATQTPTSEQKAQETAPTPAPDVPRPAVTSAPQASPLVPTLIAVGTVGLIGIGLSLLK